MSLRAKLAAIHIPPTQEQIDRRNHFKLHALIDDTNENLIPMPPQVPFVPPMTQRSRRPNFGQLVALKEVAEQQQQKLGKSGWSSPWRTASNFSAIPQARRW